VDFSPLHTNSDNVLNRVNPIGPAVQSSVTAVEVSAALPFVIPSSF
jgi:hypothetical protein